MISEGPLVVFTLAAQLACGLVLVTAFCDLRARGSEEKGARQLGISVFPVAVLAMAASLFHLGRPFSAWRALLNWRTSPLSAEVLFFGLFLAAAFLYSSLWWARKTRGRLALGAVTAGLGLAVVISSSMIYLIPGREPWNSAWVPLSFLGSTFVLGGAAAAASGAAGTDTFLRKAFSAAGAAGGLAGMVSAAWMTVRFSSQVPNALAAAQLAAARHLILSRAAGGFALYVAPAGILPVAFALWRWRSSRPVVPIERAVFWAVLAGVAVGRVLMFAVGTRIPQF